MDICFACNTQNPDKSTCTICREYVEPTDFDLMNTLYSGGNNDLSVNGFVKGTGFNPRVVTYQIANVVGTRRCEDCGIFHSGVCVK